MKSERKIVTFTCDFCKKSLDFAEGFPYGLGWIYVHDLSMQIPSTAQTVLINGVKNYVRLDKRDAHFCSFDCLMKFVHDIVDNAKGD